MTPTTLKGSSATVAPVKEPVDTREAALSAISRESGCDRELAAKTLSWIEDMVTKVRDTGYATYFPTSDELDTEAYAVLETVMPHGQIAAADSAHAAIEAHVLDPTRDEFGLLHDMQDPEGSPAYCTVQVALGVVQT